LLISRSIRLNQPVLQSLFTLVT